MSWQFDSDDWAVLQLRALHLAGQRGRVYFHMAGAGVVGSVHVQPDSGPELAACSCGRFFQPCDGIGGDRCAICADPSVSRDDMERDLAKVFGGPVEIVEASFGNAVDELPGVELCDVPGCGAAGGAFTIDRIVEGDVVRFCSDHAAAAERQQELGTPAKVICQRLAASDAARKGARS